MQPLPTLPAQAPHHGIGTGNGKRNHEYKRNETDSDEGALDHVLPHLRNIEKMIEPQEGREMQQRVEKGEQAQHAPQFDQPMPLGQTTQRRDGERNTQEIQSPVTGIARNEFNRIGTETIGKREDNQAHERQTCDRKHEHLDQSNLERRRAYHEYNILPITAPAPRTPTSADNAGMNGIKKTFSDPCSNTTMRHLHSR